MPAPATATGPRPYLAIASRSLFPLVLTCEHASSRLPNGCAVHAPARQVLSAHWGWDIGAWALTHEVARLLGASAIGGRWSRLWIDLNRRVDDPTLIRPQVQDVALAWNRGLTLAEVERRIQACHVPYHAEIDRLLMRRLLRGIRPWLLAVHSFTPELGGHTRGFDIGLLYERHLGPARRLGRSLRQAGLSVRYNQPYSGMAGMMYAAERHGAHHRLPCLELEVNQALFERPAGSAYLGSLVARALKPLLLDRQEL